MSFEAAALAEGWIDLRFAWAAGKIVVRVNGTTRECPLPRDWSGAIGFAPGGSWSWRSLQVYGQADFEPPAKAGAFEGVPQVKRDLKSSWGTWVSPRSTKNEISLGSGEEVEWAAPANWEAGNDYRVVFGMRLLPGATVMFDIGVGDGHRRVSLGAEGGSGFVLGGSLFRSGLAAADPGAREVSVEIFVYGGSARILMEGSEVWRGQVPASNRGGLTVGSSGGRVIFSDLKVSVLEP
ncbi:MAG: hypothetical protein K8T20_01860 [Planctomycetes bacterium]|nr:hypothetical protein [Planctomycetota bacterium]